MTILDLDDEKPVLQLNGDANITHEAVDDYVDANASWTDLVDGKGMVVTQDEVKVDEPGIYVLSYNYTDSSGNVAEEVVRTVTVVDTTLPVITLNGDANMTHEAGICMWMRMRAGPTLWMVMEWWLRRTR